MNAAAWHHARRDPDKVEQARKQALSEYRYKKQKKYFNRVIAELGDHVLIPSSLIGYWVEDKLILKLAKRGFAVSDVFPQRLIDDVWCTDFHLYLNY
jgi:hypothetical protein